MKVQLVKLAHARSGDKGDTANVGLIALKDDYYPLLVREVTAGAVKAHFGHMVKGDVERFELPKVLALNFVLYDALAGGASRSLRIDTQGKLLATSLLDLTFHANAWEDGNG